jgi:hypothetical protein
MANGRFQREKLFTILFPDAPIAKTNREIVVWNASSKKRSHAFTLQSGGKQNEDNIQPANRCTRKKHHKSKKTICEPICVNPSNTLQSRLQKANLTCPPLQRHGPSVVLPEFENQMSSLSIDSQPLLQV